MRRIFALLVLGAVVLGVVYYWKYQPHRLPQISGDKLGSVGTKLGEVGETVGDKFRTTKTKGAVKAALELNRNVSTQAIDVDTREDGTVVLKGEVPSEDVRLTAERVVASVPDVTRVDNQLRVNPSLAAAASEGRSLGENFDDHALAAKVKVAYSLNKEMKGADVAVSAFRREVTLGGIVTSDAQRQLAVQIAQQMPQVAAVKDGLQVAGGTAAPPAAPAANAPAGSPLGAPAADRVRAVQAALAGNPNLAGYRLEVQDQEGRLVLKGRVRTSAEKDLAGVLARDAASAAVQNNVVVQP